MSAPTSMYDTPENLAFGLLSLYGPMSASALKDMMFCSIGCTDAETMAALHRMSERGEIEIVGEVVRFREMLDL